MTELTVFKESLEQEEREIQKQFEDQKANIQAKVAEYEKALTTQNQNVYNQKMTELKGKRLMLAEIEKHFSQE